MGHFPCYIGRMHKSTEVCWNRAGASKVTAVEINEHLCDVAADTFCRNGYAHCCTVINKDVRLLKVESDTEVGLAERANLCVFEVKLYPRYLLTPQQKSLPSK